MMTEQEKQEIKEVTGDYGTIRRKYWEDLTEIREKQKEMKIQYYNGEMKIMELHKQLNESDERLKFVEMTKTLDEKSVEFKKYFHSRFLKEFNDIDISPDSL